jgi:hypothetical protein
MSRRMDVDSPMSLLEGMLREQRSWMDTPGRWPGRSNVDASYIFKLRACCVNTSWLRTRQPAGSGNRTPERLTFALRALLRNTGWLDTRWVAGPVAAMLSTHIF